MATPKKAVSSKCRDRVCTAHSGPQDAEGRPGNRLRTLKDWAGKTDMVWGVQMPVVCARRKQQEMGLRGHGLVGSVFGL